MGGSRKKSFIDKKNAVTYALMARPETEEGEDDGEGSTQTKQQMWMRKDNNRHVRDALADAGGVDDGSVFDDSATETMSSYSGMSGYSNLSSMSNVTWIMTPNGPMPRRERLTRDKRRELRELGFDPNDGYDYTRHLRKVGEGGGTMFVPTRKDHVKGILGKEDGEIVGPSEHKTVSAGGSAKRGSDSEQVFLREDVERDGDAAVAITDNARKNETESDDSQRWTHERVKAITDERVYVAKHDNTLRNAVVARQTSAPRSGTAAVELAGMIDKMEEFELAEDEQLPDLSDQFNDGGLGDLQDDFVLQAMMGGDLTGDGGSTSNPNLSFPPIKLRYDPSEVENELAAIEEAVEEDLLDEEEEELANGGHVFGGFGGGRRGPGSDAGTDRSLDEDDWDVELRDPKNLGADKRDVDTMFEAMAHGYDSDEIGELDEDDPRIFGHAELDRFGSILEEFRAEQRPEQYRTAADLMKDGANASEMDRRWHEIRKKDDDALFEDDGVDDVDMKDMDKIMKKMASEINDDDDELDEDGISKKAPAVPRITEDDVHDAFRAMIATRRRAGLQIPEHLMGKMTLEESEETENADSSRRFELEESTDGPSAPLDGEEIEYLRNAPRDDWDCETIVSTYSNLENHPSLIDEPHGVGHGKRRGKRNGGSTTHEANGVGASLIRLSDSNGLPVDYVQSKRGKARGGSNLTAANLAAIGEVDGEGEAGYDDEFSEDESIEDEWRSNIRRKGETPEEKKLRKAAVKAGRRDARAAKKGLKTTFKQEERVMGKKQMVGDLRPGLSVTQLG